MSLQLNNQNDGYYDNVFLLNTTTFLFDEVRDLIAGGGGGGGGGGNFTNQNWEDTNSTVRVLQPNTTGQLLYNSIMLVDMQVLQQNLANYTQTAQLNTLLAGKVDNSRVLPMFPVGRCLLIPFIYTPANTVYQ